MNSFKKIQKQANALVLKGMAATNVFRQTAKQLEAVNAELETMAGVCRDGIAELNVRLEMLECHMKCNDEVRRKITDIVG